MFILLILLIPLIQNLVSAEQVISRLDFKFTTQIFFPQHKLKPGSQKEVVLSPPSGTQKFKVICEEYEVHDPKMKIYTDDGILVEAATVFADNPCDESKIKNFIKPQNSEGEKLVVIYLWASKVQTCVRRTYQVKKEAMVAIVIRSDYPVFDCPSTVTQSQNNGVVNLLLNDQSMQLDYTKNLAKAATPRTVDFTKPDFKGKKFSLICREDKLNSGSDYVTGAVVHEHHEQTPLEKFEMKSCGVENINVNRQIVDGEDDFKIVFKSKEGPCFERVYKFTSDNSLFYFSVVRESLEEPEKVTCPNSFEGDIEENAHRSLYTRLTNAIRFRKILPYGREIVTTPTN